MAQKQPEEDYMPDIRAAWTEEEWQKFYEYMSDIEDNDERDSALLEFIENG